MPVATMSVSQRKLLNSRIRINGLIFLCLLMVLFCLFVGYFTNITKDYVVSEDDSQFPLTFYRQQNSYKDNKLNPAEKEPHLILIVTFWRSGSSWLGQLISKAPKTFYSYEPIHMLINDSINDLGMNIPEPVKFAMVRQLFQCGVSTEFMRDYKRWNEIYPKRHCSGEDECPPLDITDVVDDCLNADYRIIKTVRLNLETVEDFFRLPSFRMLKVIFLVRDPRGTMKSMTHIAKEKKIWNVTAQEMCSRIRNNAIMFHTLNRLYPNRLYFLRYEDMSLRPFEKALELWRFINASSTAVDIPEGWKTFLNESQTSKNITEAHDHPFNIKARSTKYWQAWRTEISKGDFNEVQKYCKDVLENLGYKEFRSFKIMRNMSISSITKKNCENIPC